MRKFKMLAVAILGVTVVALTFVVAGVDAAVPAAMCVGVGINC